ncbi:type VII secretion protein EssC [Paenibacillus sp. KS-LC4]|uniref:type VII secretion protein EssC n=1 Tax=Paenibacillus sp. KS-LC4 TaxID=2979727 RepID=UPI0030CDB3DF
MDIKNENDTQIQRTPRIMPYYPEGELVLQDPAKPLGKPTFAWLTILVPPLAMLVVAIFMSTLTKSHIMLISTIGMTTVTVVVSILNYRSTVKKHEEQTKKQEKKYLDYLFNIRYELLEASNQQREALRVISPSIDECISIVRQRQKQLWERTAMETDFLTIRIGNGMQPLALNPTYTSNTKAVDEDNPLEKIASTICEELAFVQDVPVQIPLQSINTLGLFGKRAEVSEFLNAMLVHLTTHHGFDDVKIVGLFDQTEMEMWGWTKWLPHTWNKDRDIRFLASNEYEASILADVLLPEMKRREEDKPSYGTKTVKLPHYVFLMLAPELWEESDLMKYIVSNNDSLGITSIFISERIDVALPLNSQVILEVKNGQGMTRKDLNHCMGQSTYHFLSDSVSSKNAEIFARMLAPLTIKETKNNSFIPPMVTFLDSFNVKLVEELNVTNRWSTNQANRTLSVPLGQASAGKTLLFDMHEKNYGPHGLVAGTTGSGKSELLQSLLLALAVNYHPHEIAFVLIDYKGGGMANAFAGLPHLVGTITNLGGNQINRALASIKSELLRRQRLFGEAGVTSIDDYIVLYREQKVQLPLPHLIIVVDEFAELKSDQPEFMKELVSAARVGRSLGIHLILATQKPSGVVDDQIWSNSRFKLCLKVQTPSDSQEMLKRPDAAEIKEKGRGYLQVGNNEVFTLFQSSWSGAPYNNTDSEQEIEIKANALGFNGERKRLLPKVSNNNESKRLNQLESVVKYINQVSEERNIREAFQLWLPPLPELLSLQELLVDEEGWDGQQWTDPSDYLVAPVGLIDNPSQQAQYQLKIDFGRDGHLLIYGAPSSGKTTMLKTILMSLALKYNPDYVHFYILDFGTRTLGVFNDIPHLGDVIYPEDEQKVDKLLQLLLNELEDRKRKFSKLGISNLVAYRSYTKEEIPSIVVALDNYTGFAESYVEQVLELGKLVREGGNYGIYFVFTGNAINTFPYRIAQNIKQSIVFQMVDSSDYSSIVGRTEGLEPAKVVGRGLVKDQIPLEFQGATPVEGGSDDQIAEGIRVLSGQMKDKWKKKQVKTIAIIPEELSIKDFIANAQINDGDREGKGYAFPIGLDWDNTLPFVVDASSSNSLLISYAPTVSAELLFATLLHSMSAFLEAERVKINVFDSSSVLKSSEVAHMENVHYMRTESEFSLLTHSVIEQLQIRKNDSREYVANMDDPDQFNESDYILSKYPLFIICLPDLKASIELMDGDSLQHLERIARFGGGLGVHLLIGGLADDIDQLQLVTSLVPLLAEGESKMLVGGKPFEHTTLIGDSYKGDFQELNRKMQDGEARLILKNEIRRLKMPTAL